MKRILKLIPALVSALFLFPVFSFSQNLTGIWRGNFFSERGDQYKIEVQLENKGRTISGVTYSYLTTVFYGKATMTGNFNKASEKVLFEEIKTVELRMSGLAVACIMKYNLVYTKSGKEEFLEGTYTSKYEKDSYGGKKGDDCGDGRVYLRKVPESDFPLEPFLKARTKKTDTARVVKKDSAKPKTNNPVVKKTTPQKPATTKPNTTTSVKKPAATTTKPPATKPPVVALKKPVIDSATKIEKSVASEIKPKIYTPKNISVNSRQNELAGSLKVNNDYVKVKLYDNGEIDGDTISVYLDGKLVLSKQRLTTKPLELSLKMEQPDEEHVLIMVAENLGRIPPNTSLMIVESGDDRYTVRISSSYQKNAMVRFKYEKK